MTVPVVDFSQTPTLPFVVFAANQGDWANSLVVRYSDFNQDALSFKITVFDKQIPEGGNSPVLMFLEEWTVSRNYQKDSYGKQMFLETRINGNSPYIYVVNNNDLPASVMPANVVASELLATGNGTATTFAGNLVQANNLLVGKSIQPGSLKLSLDDGVTYVAFDAGNGQITGGGITGTLNYASGTYSIKTATALANNAKITAFYRYSSSVQLAGGNNGTPVTVSTYLNALAVLEDPNLFQTRYLVEPEINGLSEQDHLALQREMVRIAEHRGDCVAILNIPSEKKTVTDILHWRKNIQAINSSYAMLVGPDVRVRDPYNDSTVLMKPAAFVAAAIARTHNNVGLYADPMGPTNGRLTNIVSLSKNFSQSEYDLLYPERVNLIMNFPDTGPVLYGSRTLLSISSLLMNVSVRFLINSIRQDLVKFLRGYIGRRNIAATRQQVESQINAYLETREGLINFRVQCDETNNPASVMDQNLMLVDVYVYPEVGIQFIQLRTSIYNGVTFQEMVSTDASL